MKAAICFFGIPRFYDESLQLILEKFSGFDLFAHFWLTKDFKTKKFEDFKLVLFEEQHDTRKHGFPGLRSPINLSHAIEQFNVLGLESLDRQYEEPGWFTKPVNVTSMWNSMAKSVSLALTYSCTNKFNYDRIILIRTDLRLFNDLNVENLFIGDVHKFLMPPYHPGSRIDVWLPDHIISMSERAARELTFLPQMAYHYYYIQNVPLIPESMLGYHFLNSGCIIQKSGLEYRREYQFWSDNGKI